MWGDDYYAPTPDEDAWEQHRDDQRIIVNGLIDFLIDLKILGPGKGSYSHDGFDVAGFIDRHWKV